MKNTSHHSKLCFSFGNLKEEELFNLEYKSKMHMVSTYLLQLCQRVKVQLNYTGGSISEIFSVA